MNIDKIIIQNFRNIGAEKEFLFNPKFTVIIGINGKGKSTILHALRVASGTYFLAIPEVASRHIQKEEIRIEEAGKLLLRQYPVKVEAIGNFPNIDNPIIWRRQWLDGSSSATTKNADVGEIKTIASDKYNQVMKNANDKIGLPVIAFFGTSRVFGAGRVTNNSRIQRLGREIFKEGYQDWDEMKSSKFHYAEWLGTYDTLVSLDREYDKTKVAFINALRIANPYLTEIEFINGELWVKIDIEGNVSDLLPLSLHSDGVHYFTAMVAELAYRCIVLNGYLNEAAVRNSKGIVMIDEIDLHLHPNWQRHVVNDLKSAFPNIQFVVTTHSPYIVQSINNEELINLDLLTTINPKEYSIEIVSEEVMNVNNSFGSDEVVKEQIAFDYFKLLNEAKSEQNEMELKMKLEQIENSITDSGLRAFLKTNRISKNII